ncbi:hypothetical protein VTJ04DRAFT_2398 [Mycothermus thermophilus]|uniref:uncharacterized protein n=1 Tax=Humicola insolens TaxID=85995 RepID=UPI0037444CD3
MSRVSVLSKRETDKQQEPRNAQRGTVVSSWPPTLALKTRPTLLVPLLSSFAFRTSQVRSTWILFCRLTRPSPSVAESTAARTPTELCSSYEPPNLTYTTILPGPSAASTRGQSRCYTRSPNALTTPCIYPGWQLSIIRIDRQPETSAKSSWALPPTPAPSDPTYPTRISTPDYI